MKPALIRLTRRRLLAAGVGIGLVAAGALIALLVLPGGAEPPFATEGFVGPRASPQVVRIRDGANAVTFTNADGEWTIFKRCLGTDVAGVGYIARYVSRHGYVVSNDYREGGSGELNNPDRGGIGTFGLELARGAGARTWNTTWHLSMRRCGPFGVTHWSRPAVGRAQDDSAFYRQTVWLGDGWTDRLLRIVYRWRFRRTGVDLYGRVTSLCGPCRSSLGAAFVKEPKLVVALNGQAAAERFSHFSTFTGAGRSIAEPAGSRDDECSYAGWNARKETGHCFDEERERVRWDYADEPGGRCDETSRACFNAAFRSHARAVERWESGSGLEGWAHAAAADQPAGSAACETMDGVTVHSPAQENARTWEYAALAPAPGEPFSASMVMAKGWDGSGTRSTRARSTGGSPGDRTGSSSRSRSGPAGDAGDRGSPRARDPAASKIGRPAY